MPYTVNRCFEKFRKDIVDLNPAQVAEARPSRDFVLSNIVRLSGAGRLPNVATGYCFNFGSFARRTKIRPLDDIDMMICFDGRDGVYRTVRQNERYHIVFKDGHPFFDALRNDDGETLNSRKVINQLIGAMSGVEAYSKAELHRNQEAATLQLKSYPWNFDIVPCFYTTTGFYLIPDGQGHWKNTDPRIDRVRTMSTNQKSNGEALPLIRLMNWWKKEKWGERVSSYMFEQMILDCIEASPFLFTNPLQARVQQVLLYLRDAIKNPVLDPKHIQGNLNDLDKDTRDDLSMMAFSSSLSAAQAIKFEKEGEIQKAVNQWKLVFGDEFPSYGA